MLTAGHETLTTPSSARHQVAALVLAAGLSSRSAPRNKLLTQMPSGQSIIAQTVSYVLATSARPVLVVTGHQEDRINAVLAGKPVSFHHAPRYAEGMSASLHHGIAAIPPNISAVLICLGDMPLVETETMEQIIAAYNPSEGREIILPCYQGRRGNPILWGKRFFDELRQLSGDSGGRQILHRYVKYTAELPAKTNSVLRDFDTLETLN